MRWTSIVAIYFLLWVMSAFLLLPFGMRTNEDLGLETLPGHADSAPANFRPGRLALRATLIAAVLTALFAINYTQGWIGIEDIDITRLFN